MCSIGLNGPSLPTSHRRSEAVVVGCSPFTAIPCGLKDCRSMALKNGKEGHFSPGTLAYGWVALSLHKGMFENSLKARHIRHLLDILGGAIQGFDG